MKKEANFLVSPRLTRLLGETYKSSELALKELVDNAWDAEARNVWIEIPGPMSGEYLTVKDDGEGMSSAQIQKNYLNIASDKIARAGERTKNLNRRVKGRKGIGKFAGLTIASVMQIQSFNSGQGCSLKIDKNKMLNSNEDLEAIPLELEILELKIKKFGTVITLIDLNQNLNFPNPDLLREILFREYSGSLDFSIFVNGVKVSFLDVSGQPEALKESLRISGATELNFTIANKGRGPKNPGISIRVSGKIVGEPSFFGLEEDEEISKSLLSSIFGEISIEDQEGLVTADWGSLNISSKAYQELSEYIRKVLKEKLQAKKSQRVKEQKARLKKEIDQKLEKVPPSRRELAKKSILRLLEKYFDDSDKRAMVIVDVALDAMEDDNYWQIIEKISETSKGNVVHFADALSTFGLYDLSVVHRQTERRIQFLDSLEILVDNKETNESVVHTALDKNLWVFGRKYSMMSSNITLSKIVEKLFDKKYQGEFSQSRPDLLLYQEVSGSYLLIEYKRPSQRITRDHVYQAEKYRDELVKNFDSSDKIEIMIVGKNRDPALNMPSLSSDISILSYKALISEARNDLAWLLNAS